MAKHDSNFMLDTIAKITAKTVLEVNKVYHDASPDEKRQEQETEKTESEKHSGSFPFGTPFSDIIKFTSEVEVFTRHIDSFTRECFRKTGRNCDSPPPSGAKKGETEK